MSAPNAFTLPAKGITLRQPTRKQQIKDATRVNKYSDSCRATSNKDNTTRIMRAAI